MESNPFNDQEVFKFCENGDVYHMGKLLDNDKEILPLLKAFLNGQVSPPKIDAQQQKIDAAIEKLEGLQQYDLVQDGDVMGPYHELRHADGGEWVDYNDIKEALEILKGSEK